MKLFILKILTIFLSFTLVNAETNFFKEFENEVVEGYEIYYEIVDEGNITDNYELKIYEGINNGYPSYAIAFKSSKDYKMLIEIDEQLYELPKNENGYTCGYAIKSTSIMFIEIVDSKGNEVLFNGTKKLNKIHITEDDFKYINGNNQKLEFTNLTIYKHKLSFYNIVMFSALSLIVVCSAGILVLVIRRKGMFNKAVRAQGVLNLEELINEAKQKKEEDIWEGYKPVIDADSDDIIEEEALEEYIDLNAYLVDKGYLLDYSLFSEDEKNKLMIELMMLKDSKKISEDTYYEETYKLWKK